ncbi:MAG: type II toxin-antitoxin system RelE/ParE family toxin [Bacteroidales bacterium]|nr:type II toxin-antitoxin system RelE/ParE family toxin [Bacteroidales bacterium]
MSIMTVYKVEMRASALRDLAELRDWLRTVMSREGAHRYVTNMRNEVMSLSVYADLYRPSLMADIRQYHPKARRMVSHNRRWVFIFHVEEDTVIVDRIRPSMVIAK